MLGDERREELVRFERTFNVVRVGGAGLAFVLGPYFPNLGTWSLVLLGVGLLTEAAVIEAALRRTRSTGGAERLSRAVYFIDLIAVAFAIFVFSSAPRWTTYIVMPLLIIAGGFRFGRRGGLLGAGGMSPAYVAVAGLPPDAHRP